MLRTVVESALSMTVLRALSTHSQIEKLNLLLSPEGPNGDLVVLRKHSYFPLHPQLKVRAVVAVEGCAYVCLWLCTHV
jgi:hypothetical protein